MRIACLAWGSLVWKWEPLVLETAWRDDGPLLPVEFSRVGPQGELATALCPGAPLQPVQWALLACRDVPAARELLRRREQIPAEHEGEVGSFVASASPGLHEGPLPGVAATIRRWAEGAEVEAVVWTASPPRFGDEDGRAPSADEAVAYLDGLRGAERAHAEDYVRRVSAQIRTPCRAAIEQALDWTAH